MALNSDFKEFIELLNTHEVAYLVVGGYAVAMHGHPRYTKDIDIWLERSKENAEKIVNVLSDFGFSNIDLVPGDFLKPSQTIQLGYPPNRIDLLTNVSGVEFKSCYNSKKTVNMEGVFIDFIGLECLKKNKAAVGRLQDLADLENLE